MVSEYKKFEKMTRMDKNIFHAAKKGDLKALQECSREHVTQGLTFEGNTALHIAARGGHLEVVKWLLALKLCSAGARNRDKNTPLHEAGKNGNSEVVRILLRYKKCCVYRRNQFGETALIIASEHGHIDAAKLLLEATPLFLVFWPRNDRQTCLNAAAYAGKLGVVKLILNENPSCFNIVRSMLLIEDEYGFTPLHAAVHGGHLDVVREILKTPLKWGCLSGYEKLMTKVDQQGRCAIHIAVMKGFVNIVDEFISSMPDCVEIRSTCLKSAVHFAVLYNQLDIVKRLASENEDEISAKLFSHDCDLFGNTALHLAAMNAVDPEIVEYIVSIPNVNLNTINDKGQSPLDMAEERASQNRLDCSEIISILKDGHATRSLICQSRYERLPWQYSQEIPNQGNGNEETKILDVDILVASLIATITFASIFQVPGGIDDKGLANRSSDTIFKVFLFSNFVAFFASITVVIAWVFRERLQTKLMANRSILAKLSMLSLGTSIVSTGLAFLSANILVTIPRTNKENRIPDHKEFQMIKVAEILIAYIAPSLAIMFLSVAWLIEYNFKATNKRQSELKKQLRRVLISTLPIATIILTITFIYLIY
ncbi:ankyrin repeat-containing protein At5g02620 [Cryptomeria japonica]|uniref:ankyrin repeat-containing protein At5g02620 n=1 Tax=Cryptomeria japonica TaxID=3369 RepID=UPI0027DA4086|nr:ankyrin repeat-containing protein At5g02620 [Cryptomeria japonica]